MISVKYPNNSHLKNPELSGLYATRNFYLEHNDNKQGERVSLGCWHILPNQLAELFADELLIDKVKDFAIEIETYSNLIDWQFLGGKKF